MAGFSGGPPIADWALFTALLRGKGRLRAGTAKRLNKAQLQSPPADASPVQARVESRPGGSSAKSLTSAARRRQAVVHKASNNYAGRWRNRNCLDACLAGSEDGPYRCEREERLGVLGGQRFRFGGASHTGAGVCRRHGRVGDPKTVAKNMRLPVGGLVGEVTCAGVCEAIKMI